MDKIRKLLEQLNGSKELTESIVTELQNFEKRIKNKYDEAFKKRLEKAKEVCLEETEAEKRRLARKVEIFLEARVGKIDREARRQAAIGESESAKTLRQVRRAIDGVQIDGDGKEIQAVKESNKKLRVKLNRLMEERESLKLEAQRASGIAQKALKRNKILESKISGSKPAKNKAVNESKSTRGGNGKTMEQLRRKSESPKTSRKVMTESQVPANKTDTAAQGGDPAIMKIASQVDDSPAYVG